MTLKTCEICAHCGCGFVRSRSCQRYCSRDCKDAAYDVRRGLLPIRERRCRCCEQMFMPARQRARFCSNCRDRNPKRLAVATRMSADARKVRFPTPGPVATPTKPLEAA